MAKYLYNSFVAFIYFVRGFDNNNNGFEIIVNHGLMVFNTINNTVIYDKLFDSDTGIMIHDILETDIEHEFHVFASDSSKYYVGTLKFNCVNSDFTPINLTFPPSK